MLGRATSVQSPTTLCESSLHVTHKTRPTSNRFRTRHVNAHHKPFHPYKWRADAAATTLATDETEARSIASEDKYQLLARLADAKTDVYVGATPLGRGLVSPNDVGRQAIVTVPLHNALVISDSPSDSISIFGDKQHEAWQQHHGKMPDMLLEFLQGPARWDLRMTAWMLYVAKLDSPLWRAYSASLPLVKEMSPLLCYSPGEAQQLQLPRLVAEAGVQYEYLVYQHDRYFSSKSGQLAALKLSDSLEQTMWASAMVRSRTFSEEVGGEGLTLMVPFADLANHSFGHNSNFMMGADRRSFELRCTSSIAAGAEALITYGEDKPNDELMRDYGFVVPGNPYDRLPFLSATADPADPTSTSASVSGTSEAGSKQLVLPKLNAASLLEAAGLEGNLVTGTVPSPAGLAPGDVLAFQRRRCALLSLPVSDGFAGSGGKGLLGIGGLLSWPPKAWTASGEAGPQRLLARDVAGERAGVEAVRQACLQELRNLATSAAQDGELLAASGKARVGRAAGAAPLAPRHEAAVRCRVEYKLIVEAVVGALDRYEVHLGESSRLSGSL